MDTMNVYQKLQKARVELQSRNLKKTGFNAYANNKQGFYYFQLDDFLPSVIEIFNNLGLFGYFNIDPKTTDSNGMVHEIAVLKIMNLENLNDYIEFKTETAEAGTKGTDIQNLGSKHTYMRRYLYMEALEITESDRVDCLPDDEKKKASKPVKSTDDIKATPKQIEEMKQLYPMERIEKMLAFFKVGSLAEMSVKQASAAIKKGREEQNG